MRAASAPPKGGAVPVHGPFRCSLTGPRIDESSRLEGGWSDPREREGQAAARIAPAWASAARRLRATITIASWPKAPEPPSPREYQRWTSAENASRARPAPARPARRRAGRARASEREQDRRACSSASACSDSSATNAAARSATPSASARTSSRGAVTLPSRRVRRTPCASPRAACRRSRRDRASRSANTEPS